MEFDIHNNETRLVVCVDNEPNKFAGWSHADMLIIGGVYTCVDVEIHSWHTLITLKEFPGIQFNSCMFEEVEN